MFGWFKRKKKVDRYLYNGFEVLYAQFTGQLDSLKAIRQLGFETPKVPISKKREVTVKVGNHIFRVKAKAGFFYNLKGTDVYGYKETKEFYESFTKML